MRPLMVCASNYDKRQAQLQNEQLSLTAKIQELTDKLKSPAAKKNGGQRYPAGAGPGRHGQQHQGSASQGSDGMMWVAPTDRKRRIRGMRPAAKASPQFPTSFSGENELTRQKSRL